MKWATVSLFQILLLCTVLVPPARSQSVKAGEEALGTRKYDEYQRPKYCGGSCRVDFFQQWSQRGSFKYQSISGHLSYLLARNFRLVGEYTREFERKANIFSAGFVAAF